MKISDLGELWYNAYNLSIPLGGIIGRKELGINLLTKVSNLIKESLLFARENPISSSEFVAKYAMEIKSEITKKHIDLYVNKHSLQLDNKAISAINQLFNLAVKKKIIKKFDPSYLI